MLDLVKQTSVIGLRRFNDMTDFDIKVNPGVIWDELNTFNTDMFDDKFEMEKKEGKCILLKLKSQDEEAA